MMCAEGKCKLIAVFTFRVQETWTVRMHAMNLSKSKI